MAGGSRLSGRLGSRAAGAVAAQGINACGSLVIQIVAARVLGAHTFGSLVLLTSCLILCTALYTAFVGDSLTVLDRHDPAIRGAVTLAHVGLASAGALIGFVVALGLAGLGPGPALAFAALTLLWLNEELCRRILMARLEFWKLATNDAVYVAVTLTTLGALAVAGMTVSLPVVVLAMATGAVVAIALALVQIPWSELRPGRPPGRDTMREVAGFAVWRSLQAGVTPTLLFTARTLISAFAGRATLGQIESARLLLAPAQTVVSAAGNVLLPMFSRGGGPAPARRVRRASAALIGATLVVGAIAVAVAGPLTRLVVGPDIDVPRTAVLAWAAYTCALALGLPAATALVAQRRTGTVFLAWIGDAVIGVALVTVLLAAGHPAVVPAGLAAARATSALCLHVLASRASSGGATRPGSGYPRAWVRARSLGATARCMPRLLPSGNRWALAIIVLPLMVASDYKLRMRDKGSTTAGQADIFILVEIAIYLAVAALLLLTVARAPSNRRNATVVSLAWVFGLYSFLAAAWSPFSNLAVVRGAQLLLTLAVAQTIARQASRAQLHGLAHAFTSLVGVSVLVGLAVRFPPVSHEMVGRFTWLYVHPVVAGIYLGAATVIVTLYLTRAGRIHRMWPAWVYQVLLAIVGYGLFASRTRGALAAAVIAILLAMVMGAHGARRTDLLATIGIFVTIALITSTGTILAYLSRGESTEKLATLNERTNLWALAFDAFEEKPLIGWGLTASRGIFLDEIGLGGGHNVFINIMVDGGVIGLLLWLGMLGALAGALLRLWRRVRPENRADLTLLTSLVVFLLIDGFTAEHMAAPANVANILLFVLIGWAGALQRRRRPPVAPPTAPTDTVTVYLSGGPQVPQQPDQPQRPRQPKEPAGARG